MHVRLGYGPVMIRDLDEISGTERDVQGPGWRSRRLVVAEDGLKYSFHLTTPARSWLGPTMTCRKPYAAWKGEARHHLYVSPKTSDELQAQLRFRDRIRTDPVLAGEYEALKRDLAERYRDDRPGYTEAKTGFIEAALLAE